MKKSAVLLARVLGYVETHDLGQGRIFWPDIVPEIIKRYSFQKFPKELADFDETKGVEFLEGKIGDKVIQKLAVWSNLLVLETRSDTADSKQILEDMLVWGAKNFGLTYHPGMIKHFAYVSDVTFFSDIPLLGGSPGLKSLTEKTSTALTEIWLEPIRYEPVNLAIGHDPLVRKYGIAPFSIMRRAEARFSENKYFSEAPLPTDMHWKFLEEFERDVSRAIPPFPKE